MVPSRVGVLVKQKGDKCKVRLTHDLSRSGVNHRIRLPERVVLPRLSDVIKSTAALLATRSPGIDVELLVLDFRDAFKHLHVDPDEQRFPPGFFSGGWFAYFRFLFGIVTGPLSWCQVAACLMRVTQAMFTTTQARLACS